MSVREMAAYALAAVILFLALVVASAYYFATCDSLRDDLQFVQAPARCIR
jgi:hypothetical protein